VASSLYLSCRQSCCHHRILELVHLLKASISTMPISARVKMWGVTSSSIRGGRTTRTNTRVHIKTESSDGMAPPPLSWPLGESKSTNRIAEVMTTVQFLSARCGIAPKITTAWMRRTRQKKAQEKKRLQTMKPVNRLTIVIIRS
jgi:hypothetical protein